jgi:acetyl coenzyme A synthetase (ADP forming)-like protein
MSFNDSYVDQSGVVTLRPILCPKSIAVVGASRQPASIGHRVFAGLLKHHFQGSVFPVNPKAEFIEGHRVYPSVRDLPVPVDLAVIVTPRDVVIPVLEDCAAHGIKAAVVISAGFAETGVAGRELQVRMREVARRSGIRMVGPNCLGIINTDPAVRLNASFAPSFPRRGRVAMSSQSGGLGIALQAEARRRGLGLSTFVSVGNKADISSNDLLEYWEQDPATDVILLYLESFGNPRRFARIARRVGRTKPIIAIKGGRTAAGGRAAGSHTAALAEKEVAVEALFRQSGVIHVQTLAELFDVAEVLTDQPLPAGNRVGIVTNAGGPGILAADTCETARLVVPAFSQSLQRRLAEFLPCAAGLANPVDMVAAAGPSEFQSTIVEVLKSGEVDALITLYVNVGTTTTDELAKSISNGIEQAVVEHTPHKPVVACLISDEEQPNHLSKPQRPVPCFLFPEAAVRALGRAVEYAQWKREPLGSIPSFPNGFGEAKDLCQCVLQTRGSDWLSAEEVRTLLLKSGFVLLPGGVAFSSDEAIMLAEKVGFPVAVKLSSRTVVHKSEVGGVRLNLPDGPAVRSAFVEMKRYLEMLGQPSSFEGVVVQPMINKGVEVVMGMTHDSAFGPLLMFGLGGIHVEVLADVCFRITPLTDKDAAEMIRAIRGHMLLEGYRGTPRCDIAALEQLLLRLSRLVEAVPEIVELDFNPVMALSDGYELVDARIRIASANSPWGQSAEAPS